MLHSLTGLQEWEKALTNPHKCKVSEEVLNTRTGTVPSHWWNSSYLKKGKGGRKGESLADSEDHGFTLEQS